MIMDQDNWKLSCNGGLANVAPTVLQLMGIRQPETMPEKSLLLKSFKRVERRPERHESIALKGVA
jgi:2,3-bisphosphoglycerate-independent phosphoglycerate mutase